jgi:hypothetical protein
LAKGNLEALAELEQGHGKRKVPAVFGRGHPSKDFIKRLQEEGIKYVMRVRKGFNARIGRRGKGSERVRLGEGISIRALAFALSSGEREALVTNPDEGETGDSAFAELHYKRRPIETKHGLIKRKLELEDFSGRLVGDIRQDFYAMTAVSNAPAGRLREADGRIKKEQAQKGNRRECQASVNHAAGALEGRLVGTLVADGPKISIPGTGARYKTADNSDTAKPGSAQKGMPEKTSFPS